MWGYTNAGETAAILFGAARAGLQHDFPSRLEQFRDRTGEVYGRARALAEGRTLLRYYWPFLPTSEVDAAIAAMAGDSVAHLKFRLGLLTSRFRANHPLKACLECMAQDLVEHGWCYWHLEHQYPGVWLCAVHGTLLRSSNMKATGVGRFQWNLPDEGTLALPVERSIGVDLGRVSRLSATIGSLIARAVTPGVYQLESVRQTLLEQAALQSWVTRAGRLRMVPAATDYVDYCRPLKVLQDFAGLPTDHAQACNQLGLIFHPS